MPLGMRPAAAGVPLGSEHVGSNCVGVPMKCSQKYDRMGIGREGRQIIHLPVLPRHWNYTRKRLERMRKAFNKMRRKVQYKHLNRPTFDTMCAHWFSQLGGAK